MRAAFSICRTPITFAYRPANYMSRCRYARLAPSGLRAGLQLRRRISGRRLQAHSCDDSSRRQLERLRRRPGHPRRRSSDVENLDAGTGWLTKVGAGGKFDNNAYKVAAGLHGVGAKAVTALSELTRAEVRRNGRTYVQEYDRGRRSARSRTSRRRPHGHQDPISGRTRRFSANATFVYETLEDRLRELAFLKPGPDDHLPR